MNTRVIVAEGDAQARGRIVGEACADSIRRLLECQDYMDILARKFETVSFRNGN